MELWDLYDYNRNKTGKTWDRSLDQKNFPLDLYRLVVHIGIFNSKGELLIQQRQDHKTYGGQWDFSAAGSVISGETSQQGAIRETQEELGLNIDIPPRPDITVNFDKGFDDYYLVKKDVDLKDITIQKTEVKDIKWASLTQILDMIKSGEFMAFSPDFIKLIFHIKDYGKIWFK